MRLFGRDVLSHCIRSGCDRAAVLDICCFSCDRELRYQSQRAIPTTTPKPLLQSLLQLDPFAIVIVDAAIQVYASMTKLWPIKVTSSHHILYSIRFTQSDAAPYFICDLEAEQLIGEPFHEQLSPELVKVFKVSLFC